jgi:hypothetical protein
MATDTSIDSSAPQLTRAVATRLHVSLTLVLRGPRAAGCPCHWQCQWGLLVLDLNLNIKLSILGRRFSLSCYTALCLERCVPSPLRPRRTRLNFMYARAMRDPSRTRRPPLPPHLPPLPVQISKMILFVTIGLVLATSFAAPAQSLRGSGTGATYKSLIYVTEVRPPGNERNDSCQ